MPSDSSIQVVLLGGSTGPLALARELSRRKVEVHLSLQKGRPELSTRHHTSKHPYDSRETAPAVWAGLLLGPEREFDRAVIFPCDDDAVEFVAARHGELAMHHILDRVRPEHLDAFLSKSKTAEIAKGTGVRLPRTWPVDDSLDLDEVFHSGPRAILLKPVHSHRFQRYFGGGGRKHFLVHDRGSFTAAMLRLRRVNVDAIATELIPGPDTNSVTYYTYRGEGGRPIFEFTKQVIRRFPRNEGPGSLHVARWDAEVAEASNKLLDAVGFEGYANIEFKRDERDGLPTLIEVNPRFTASQELLVRAGIPAGWIVYQSLIGAKVSMCPPAQGGLLLWDPARDIRAFAEHRRVEGLGVLEWLGSIRGRRVLLLFRWTDPVPSLRRLVQLTGKALRLGSRGR